MSLDGASSAFTYTSISSKARLWNYVPDPIELEDYVPVYISEPDYPEYLALSDDDIPAKDQPLPADASIIALSPG
ncbi:hypothetical protein Tco_0470402, partial [Tanacetum coccineum]